MTATQRIALVEIGEDGPLRVNDLAHRMGTSAATASRAVDVLETLGLVTRAPEVGDRRALSIGLSPSGRALLDDRLRRAGAAFEPAVSELSPDERRTLLGLLERMTEALRDGPGAP
jgi:DNA-binding MarR family transcriptional regulator